MKINYNQETGSIQIKQNDYTTKGIESFGMENSKNNYWINQ